MFGHASVGNTEGIFTSTYLHTLTESITSIKSLSDKKPEQHTHTHTRARTHAHTHTIGISPGSGRSASKSNIQQIESLVMCVVCHGCDENEEIASVCQGKKS